MRVKWYLFRYCSASSDPCLRRRHLAHRGGTLFWPTKELWKSMKGGNSALADQPPTETGVLTASITICCNTNIASCFWRLQCRCWAYLTCPSPGYHPASAGSHFFSTWNKCRVVWPQLLAFISSALGREARKKWNEKFMAGSVQKESCLTGLPMLPTFSFQCPSMSLLLQKIVCACMCVCVMGGEDSIERGKE